MNYSIFFRLKISPEECLLLHGFPKGFKLCGNEGQRYRQVGNSVSCCIVKELVNVFKIWEFLLVKENAKNLNKIDNEINNPTDFSINTYFLWVKYSPK
ncbi:MAG: DNA cytosine methyltransferase [Bacteroidaceae bacterium]|nr:DNA cytosine methyltransferase [Bacteroidaceae bacterium]